MTGGDDLLTAPLSVLGLIVRASNALLNNGISTVGDLLAKTEVEIATLPGIGPFALADIRAKLSARGLMFRPGGALSPPKKP